MIIEIIKHTPPWVFSLFFLLLAIGLKQTKDRNIKEIQILILPTMMILLSLFGTFSTFGLWNINACALWLIGVATAGVCWLFIQSPKDVTYSSGEKTFNIPGSWWPLTLIMAIFFIKYTLGVISVRKLPVLNELVFISLVSFLYGLLSGVFLFRAYVIWRSKNIKLKEIG